MGSLSIWHWLIIFIFFGGPICVAALICHFTKSVKRMNRREYILRICGMMIVGMFLGIFGGDQFAIIYLTLILASVILIPYWSVARLKDIGVNNRYRAIWTSIPLIGLLYQFYLMIPPSIAEMEFPPDRI